MSKKPKNDPVLRVHEEGISLEPSLKDLLQDHGTN